MKIKKLGNLKFRTKTKVYIPITVVLITVILLSSAIPVADIKLGTDGSGVNWFGPIDAITNSNNHYWAATGANFKLAYYDLNATGGTVYLPPGHFQFAISGLKLHNNSNIQGSGIGVTFVEATTGYASGAALLHNYAEPDVNNVTISDLTVFGNSSAGGFNRGCIRIDGGKDITITNVYCYNPLDRGALSITNADRVVVSDVFAYNVSGAQQGVSCDTISNAVFNNLVIWNGTGAGLDISTSHHVTVTNVVIKDTLGCKFPASENISVSNIEINNGGMNIWNTNYSSFSNVAVYNSANNGINIDEYCDYIVLNNIRINNAGTNGIVLEGRHLQINNGVIKNSSTRALSITTDAHNVTISNVDFDTFNQYNLIDLTENIKITGCSFLNGVDSDSYGLALKNCDVVKILGCSISYGASYGIVLYNTLCENVTITDCDILNNGNDGIWIGAQAHKNCLITDNTIRGNTNEQIDDDGTGDNVIINNNPGYETIIPTVNVSTAQIGFAYISGSGIMVKGSGGWFNLTVDTDTHLTEEEVEDYVGGMVTGGTETGITVTYTDGGVGAGVLNFIADGDGDPFFNSSDAYGFTWAMADGWNATAGGGYNSSLIWNSNNNSYLPTAANLQIAINDLNNETGWVFVPSRITITSAILVGDECTLYSIGHAGGLIAGSGANCSLIENYKLGATSTASYTYNITLRGLYLDGNGSTCDVWDGGNHAWYKEKAHAVQLSKTIGLTIDDCIITSSPACGVYLDYCYDGTFINSEVMESGVQMEGQATGNFLTWGFGIEIGNNNLLDNFNSHDNFGAGLVLQTRYLHADEADYTEDEFATNSTVTNCEVKYNCNGVYLEHARSIIISTNHINNNSKTEAYGAIFPYGVIIGLYSRDIFVYDNLIRNETFGICASYGNFTAKGNKVENIKYDGIKAVGTNPENVFINDNRLLECGSNAIEINAATGVVECGQIRGNYIYGGGATAMQLADAVNFTISENTFKVNALSKPDNGIKEGDAADYNTIPATNKFIGSFAAEITIVGSNSWAMWVNASTAMIGVQNCTSTYWK